MRPIYFLFCIALGLIAQNPYEDCPIECRDRFERILTDLEKAHVSVVVDRQAPIRFLPREVFRLALEITNPTAGALEVPDPASSNSAPFYFVRAVRDAAKVAMDSHVPGTSTSVSTVTIQPGATHRVERWSDSALGSPNTDTWLGPGAAPSEPGPYKLSGKYLDSGLPFAVVRPRSISAGLIPLNETFVASGSVKPCFNGWMVQFDGSLYSLNVFVRHCYPARFLEDVGQTDPAAGRLSDQGIPRDMNLTLLTSAIPFTDVSGTADSLDRITLSYRLGGGQIQTLMLDETGRVERSAKGALWNGPREMQNIAIQRIGMNWSGIQQRWIASFRLVNHGTNATPPLRLCLAGLTDGLIQGGDSSLGIACLPVPNSIAPGGSATVQARLQGPFDFVSGAPAPDFLEQIYAGN
jgi:hypothetical protein